MSIRIRVEQHFDVDDIYQVHEAAFETNAEAKLVNSLRKSPYFIPMLSLVALSENRAIAHLLFTKLEIVGADNSVTPTLALAPMAVMPDFQKQGIGKKLLEHGLNAAKNLGYTSVIVLGHEGYYPRFGFAPASGWNIKPSFATPDASFLALELVADSLKNAAGTVKYPAEFGMPG